MYLSARHNAVIYDAEYPERITAAVASARQINTSHVAVPFDVPTMQLCRFIGLPARSPILDQYDWPGRFKPFAHQREMAAFMTLHRRCFNLAQMGTAKTLACLWAADYLMSLGLVRRALILSPLSTLNRVWADEIFTHFLQRRSCAVLHGSANGRNQRLKVDVDFYILNHDGLAVGASRSTGALKLGHLGQEIRDRSDIDLVIVDEASAFKDSGTRRWKLLRQITEHKPYLWMMTGTPTPNAPTDAWALKRLLQPPDFKGDSWMNFRDRTMYRVGQFKWLPRKDAAATTGAYLQPAICYTRDECLDLPSCLIETREVPLSPAQKTAMEAMKKDLQITIGSGKPITAVNEAVLRMKMIQISLGAIYGPDREINSIDAAPRLRELLDIIEQAGAKCLIFAPLTSVVNLIYGALRKEGITVEKVTGDVGQSARSEIFRAFQQDVEPRCIVADPGTMAHGLTLTAAATIIWYGPTDRPEIYEQANARINRPGQSRNMLVVQIASTPVEREIYRRLAEKQTLQGAVLALVREK